MEPTHIHSHGMGRCATTHDEERILNGMKRKSPAETLSMLEISDRESYSARYVDMTFPIVYSFSDIDLIFTSNCFTPVKYQ